MARRRRLHFNGAHYHVTLRGNHQQDIFRCESDHRLLERYVAEALEPTRVRIHAYCWMSNHIHLLAQVADVPIGRFVQRIGTRFARAVQKREGTTGHLFQGRFWSRAVDVDAYFLELLRYVHLNPVRAKVVEDPAAYRWSSHRVYLGLDERQWVETEFGLRMFADEPQRARELYRAFVAEQIGAPRDPLLYAGHGDDPRVFGDAEFVARVAAAVDAQAARVATPASLKDIVDDVCRELGVTLELLRSPVQRGLPGKARALVFERATHSGAATVSEIGRMLNRSASVVSRACGRYR